MADLGTLSDQYRRSARIAATINDAIIPVKRHAVLHRVRNEEQLRDAQSTLATIARAFADVIETDSSRLDSVEWPDGQAPSQILLDAVREAAAPQRPYTVADLRAAAASLDLGAPLAEGQLAALELIGEATSNEAADAYRRLMRL